MDGQDRYQKKKEEFERQRMEREMWKIQHTSSELCPKCGSVMYIREGKYGKFLGCSNYPNCTQTKKYDGN
jgi:DNA topoisomerase-1